jgi:hypothetical protein
MMAHGTISGLSVMATTTVFPTMRYSPLMRWCEKRPDRPSPTRVAPYSFAAFLILANNEGGSSVVSILKVLTEVSFPPSPSANPTPGLDKALSRAAEGIIKQNVVVSLAIKGLFVLLAPFGLVALWLAVLADMGTSIAVTLNGLRLFDRSRTES